MLDLVDPIVVPDDSSDEALFVCPKCQTQFTPKRSNQKYCSKECQKKSSRNTNRGSRTIEQKDRDRLHYDRARRFAEMVYYVPVDERLGAMKAIIDSAHWPEEELILMKKLALKKKELARKKKLGLEVEEEPEEKPDPELLREIKGARSVRNILTDPKLLKAHPSKDKGLFLTGRNMTISQAANAYTQKFFGVSIQTYLKKFRAGTLKKDHPVSSDLDFGSVPRLTKSKTVKCWHKELTRHTQEVDAKRTAYEMARVSTIVSEAQANVGSFLENLEDPESLVQQEAVPDIPMIALQLQ